LRGAGAAFCTGLDLKEAADQTKAHGTADLVAQTLIALSQSRLVTIAAVHGAAVAGGAGLMSACDYVVATEKTKIGYPEVRRGLVAGLVMTFLRRQLLEREAPQMIRLITYVADRLGIVITQKELGILVPIAGAVLNSSINVAFQQVGHQTAKDYFRRVILEDRYGEELVSYAIQQEIETLRKVSQS